MLIVPHCGHALASLELLISTEILLKHAAGSVEEDPLPIAIKSSF